jgi:hypothetical protein
MGEPMTAIEVLIVLLKTGSIPQQSKADTRKIPSTLDLLIEPPEACPSPWRLYTGERLPFAAPTRPESTLNHCKVDGS